MLRKIEDQIRCKMDYILSHLDRDPFSATAGSFDRLFWGWKIKDFPDATLQRLAYPMVDNYFNVKDQVCDEGLFLSWISRSLYYLKKIQHKCGSFDQAFPNEHSHGATAFLIFDIAGVYQVISEKLGTPTKKIAIDTMIKMGDYLVLHLERHGSIANHLCGAAAGLQRLYKITQDQKYKDRASFYINKVLSMQSDEGWYMEYTGADPGYQTLAIYYLADYYLDTKDERVLRSLEKAIEFVSYFIHPDGSFGGEYASRNTEIFYPGGFALLRNDILFAGHVLDFMKDGIESGKTVNLDSIDLGNLAPLLSNYIAVLKSDRTKDISQQAQIPFCRSPFIKEFKDAGILVFNTGSNYAVIGMSKGGVIKEFNKTTGTKLRDDCGYIGKLKSSEMLSTQGICKDNYSLIDGRLEIKSYFCYFKQAVPSPAKFLVLRVLNLTIGHVYWLREGIKKVLVKVLLPVRPKRSEYMLTRKISLTCPLKVEDRLDPDLCEEKFEYLKHGIKFSTLHMAASKYFNR